MIVNKKYNSVLQTYSRSNLSFEKGEGVWLYTSEGKKYLDFASGIAVNSLGHSHPKLIKALNEQALKLWHTSNLYIIEEQEKLALQLCDLSFAKKVFFCNSGAEATEGTVKMIRHYHYSKGNSHKKNIVVFNDAFHGRTMTGISAGSNSMHRKGFMPEEESNYGFVRCSLGDINELANKIDKNTAAILIEPIQGEGGVNVVDLKYLENLRELCDKNNIILAFDEVQCGIGRTGKMFAYEWSNIEPDIMGIAKGLGGGFPVGAVLLNEEVSFGMAPGTHGSTFGGNYLAAKVSEAVLNEISSIGFLSNVIVLGDFIKKELNGYKEKYPKLELEVLGKGLMLGIKSSIKNTILLEESRERGLLAVSAGNNVLRLLPPLNLKKQEAKIALGILDNVFKRLN